MKKYGGLVVALTLDERGIPDTAQGRVDIAKRILSQAARYGIAKKDLIFDPLALTVSADPGAASQTLAAIRQIRYELGCHTLLGVSNISFGLPQRDILNGTFFALALGQGLSAGILNPHSQEMQKAYHGYCALMGLDTGFEAYLSYSEKYNAAHPSLASGPVGSDLHQAIVKGLKEQAGSLTAAMLKNTPPLTIVEQEVIPALNQVGQGFENKTIYLPQLLMSAEAAKAAFEQVKAAMPAGNAPAKCPYVIATVQGDIHDIGKNIVRLLLENFGYAVTDLGRDVPPEVITQKVVALHAPILGLSALMTTTVPAMEETIRQVRKAAPWCKIMVGGAVLNPEYAAAIGADYYSKDAMEAVRCADHIYTQLIQKRGI